MKDLAVHRSSNSAGSTNSPRGESGKRRGQFARTFSIQRWTSMEIQMMQRMDAAGNMFSCLLVVALVVGLFFLAEMRIFEGRHFAHLIRANPQE
mmetsp:Transcript_39290/g.111259  ORF Transcript_39290/g.111259 Transcript_39290/m.111259 type:complete len:94 (-) Transcript_39290:343-624(-)